MEFSRILYEKKDGAAWITLNRPQMLNCIDLQTLLDLEAAFRDIEFDNSIRAAVIKGSGRSFCSGADLKYVRDAPASEFNPYLRKWHKVCLDIENCAKPVVAAVHGHCLAGGLEVAMSCDIIVAEETANISDHHSNIGGAPSGGATQRLPRIVGWKRGIELILTGRWLTAEEAWRMGLVSRVAPAGKLMETVEEVVKVLLTRDPQATKRIKYMVNQGMQVGLRTGLEIEFNAQSKPLFAESEHLPSGVDAFLKKEKQPFWEEKT